MGDPAVVVDEPAASRICPPEWIARFEVRCIVLVPLLELDPELTLPDGTLGVRMKLGRRHIGVMRVAPSDLAPDERSIVEALAGVA